MAPDLKTHIGNFENRLKTDQANGLTWQKDRKKRPARFRTHLTEDGIEKLTGEDFAELLKSFQSANPHCFLACPSSRPGLSPNCHQKPAEHDKKRCF
jgi:hypothetical protein